MKPCRAFTLVEILIVVIILGILGAVVVPQFSDASTEATNVAASEVVGAVQRKIAEYKVLNGTWPTEIDETWFVPEGLPTNPYDPGSTDTVVQDIAGKTELQNKHTKNGEMTFWYNQATGTFHTRVPWQGNEADTLELYNRVNHCGAENY